MPSIVSTPFNLSACQKSDKQIDTKKEVAKLAGVSHDTIAKVETIEEQATPEIKEALREGELSINAAYEGVKAGAQTVEEVSSADSFIGAVGKPKKGAPIKYFAS